MSPVKVTNGSARNIAASPKRFALTNIAKVFDFDKESSVQVSNKEDFENLEEQSRLANASLRVVEPSVPLETDRERKLIDPDTIFTGLTSSIAAVDLKLKGVYKSICQTTDLIGKLEDMILE